MYLSKVQYLYIYVYSLQRPCVSKQNCVRATCKSGQWLISYCTENYRMQCQQGVLVDSFEAGSRASHMMVKGILCLCVLQYIRTYTIYECAIWSFWIKICIWHMRISVREPQEASVRWFILCRDSLTNYEQDMKGTLVFATACPYPCCYIPHWPI